MAPSLSRLAFVILALLLVGLGLQPALADTTLVLLRHAEKPALGLGQLSCQGLNRALALPTVLLAKFGKPDALFAPDPSAETRDHGQPYSYIRPLATLEPTAIQLGLPVSVKWGYKEIDKLEQELDQHKDQVLFVAWEHRQLVKLARNLTAHHGGDAHVIPAWADDDFDSLYVIRLSTRGTPEFHVERQGLNGQPDTCPRHG